MPTQRANLVNAAVLTVDDHAPNLLALQALLEPLGAEIVTARSGEEALECLKRQEFALVLMDQRMPGLSGMETVHAIHERFPDNRTPLMLLTAYSFEDAEIRQAYELGVVDILQKPFLGEVLRTKVAVFVELFRARELLRLKLEEEQRKERERFEQELVGLVSHDLQNPLSVITLGASRLLHSSADPENVRRIATRIVAAAARATRLIHDLLDFTQARHEDQIPVYPKRGDLHEVVRETLEDLQIEHGAARVTLETDGSASGEFDPDRISQVVTNLVSNAVRYGARDQPVRVRAFSREDDLVVEVTNSGEPIPEEERQHLFQPLRRGSASAGVTRGLGLGLFIVDQIARAHGGKVEVESEASRGTTFRVVLPRWRER
jgi:signal transduction histidine kinase